MSDDADLLRRYAETHSEPAFTEFVGRHLNLVYFTALRNVGGEAALAEDVTQAVFALAARRAATLRTHATPAGWLHTTTRHLAARARRKERTRQRYELAATMNDLITRGPEQEWEQLRPVIDDALDELEAREREAILVRFFEGRAFPEMGAAWKISQDAARMRVDRALEKLRLVLERRGIRSLSTALASVLATSGSLAAPAGLMASVSGAALAAAQVPGGAAGFLSFMSETKIVIGSAAVIVALATGTAVFTSNQAKVAEDRLGAVSRELTSVRAQLAQTEQKRSAAETANAEAEKDLGALLAAIKAARAKPAVPPQNSAPAASSAAPNANDPLDQTLNALFPNGIVAILGDRVITVDDVRREITPLLPRLPPDSGNPDESRQRLYALQNDVVASLITRQMNIKEFRHPMEGEEPKQIAATFVDQAITTAVNERFHGDQASFLASLNAQGITLGQYRQTVEEDIISGYMRTQQRRLTSAKERAAKPPAP